MASQSEYDPSMQFSSGSVVFSVQNVLFRIPKALLQQHSEVFSSMLDMDNDGKEEPIVLQDSLEAFRDFRSALFTPLESCLNPSNPSSSDLGRLLELLQLCHKYLATKLETHIVSLINNLTRPDVLPSTLATNNITAFRLVEISGLVNQPELAARARALIITDLWNPRAKDGYDALIFGEKSGDKEMISAAYYRLLLSRLWKLDKRLTETHRLHLRHGMTRCGEEWTKIADSWGALALRGYAIGHTAHPGCRLHDRWLQGIWVEISKAKLEWFDIVGKLCAAIKFAAQYDCLEDGRKTMEIELERVKKALYAYFVPEEAIAQMISGLQIAKSHQTE